MEDRVGKETLRTISSADKFNQWMFDTIKPFAKGNVLEIGSGIGNISDQFLDNGFSIMLTDFNLNYCQELRNRYSNHPNVLGVRQVDLVDPEFETKYGDLREKFDTVFALNVIEHIKDDSMAIANCRKFLISGGTLIILVPSYQKLYNSFDKGLGHYRRYNIPEMGKIFKYNGFKIEQTQYFNFIGILGWYLNGNILKKRNLPVGQMKIYNYLVPLFKVFDRVLQNKIGLSTIVVGNKLS